MSCPSATGWRFAVHESTQIQKLYQELAEASQLFEEKIRDLSMARRIGDSLRYARDARRVFETFATKGERGSIW